MTLLAALAGVAIGILLMLIVQRSAKEAESTTGEKYLEEHRERTDVDELYELIYEEAQKELERQALRLDEVRGRAGAILTAASISSALLGTTVVIDVRDERSVVASVAIGAFAVLGLLTAYVLFPRRDWYFGHNVLALIGTADADDYDLPSFQRELACQTYDLAVANEAQLKWLYRAIGSAAVMLVVEVIAWLVELNRGA